MNNLGINDYTGILFSDCCINALRKMTNFARMSPYLEVWKCRLRSKKSADVASSSTFTWDSFGRINWHTDYRYTNLPKNDIRAANGFVIFTGDNIVARIGGRQLYAILRVSRTMPMRCQRSDWSVMQEFGHHRNTRRHTRKHH